PDRFKNRAMLQHSIRVVGQEGEEVELLWRESDFVIASEDTMPVMVDGEIADLLAPCGSVVGAQHTPQRDADPGDELFGAERFGHVVVSAELERINFVRLRASSGKDDD